MVYEMNVDDLISYLTGNPLPQETKQETNEPAVNSHSIVEGSIHAEYYFSGLNGVIGAGQGYKASLCGDVENLKATTFCVLVLHNGYTIIGKAAVANMAQYSWELGCKYAREDAMRNAQPFGAFILKQDEFDDALMQAQLEQVMPGVRIH